MEQQQILRSIEETFLPILNQFLTTGQAEIKTDDKMLLKEIYRDIHPQAVIDVSCPTCILQYLHLLNSWYERNYIPPVVEPAAIKTSTKKK